MTKPQTIHDYISDDSTANENGCPKEEKKKQTAQEECRHIQEVVCWQSANRPNLSYQTQITHIIAVQFNKKKNHIVAVW